MIRLPLGPLSLAHGFTLTLVLTLDPLTVELEVTGPAGLHLKKTFDQLEWRVDLGLVAAESVVDLEQGELRVSVVSGHGVERQVLDEHVLHWAPSVGRVNGSVQVHPPDPGDAAGPVRSRLPTITRFFIDEKPRHGTEVGNLVKATFFPDRPEFDLNVCFAVGPDPDTYADPQSPWFNVFLGYYQIDCPEPQWDHPFGYRTDDGGHELDMDDIVRIGKADWNYLSNWVYGVPLDVITPLDQIHDGASITYLGRMPLFEGGRQWDVIDVDGFSVVSAYESSDSEAAKLEERPPLTPFWRLVFGQPVGDRAGFDQSFPSTKMHARFYASFTRDEEKKVYRTVMFGGTVNKTFDGPENEARLAAQMKACAAVIEAHYPGLGFP